MKTSCYVKKVHHTELRYLNSQIHRHTWAEEEGMELSIDRVSLLGRLKMFWGQTVAQQWLYLILTNYLKMVTIVILLRMFYQ